MKQLQEKKVDSDIIVITIGWYDIDTIVYLVNKGFCLSQDILKKEPHFYWGRICPDSIGRMVRYLAALEGEEDILNTLIKQGLDINAESFGETCLHEVISKEHAPGSTLLLKKGADPLFLDEDDETPLSMATNEGWSEGIMVLLDYIPTRCARICKLRRDISRAEAESASDKKWKNVKHLQDFTSVM